MEENSCEEKIEGIIRENSFHINEVFENDITPIVTSTQVPELESTRKPFWHDPTQ